MGQYFSRYPTETPPEDVTGAVIEDFKTTDQLHRENCALLDRTVDLLVQVVEKVSEFQSLDNCLNYEYTCIV